MKKLNMFVIFLAITTFLSIDKVNAECDNRTQLEINTASSSVSMNYNMKTLVIDRNNNVHPEISPDSVEHTELSEYTTIDQVTVNIENVTDKIYVVFENEDDGLYKVYHYQDLENGGLKYVVPDNEKIRKFKLTIYSNLSDCIDQELRTIEVITPKYNELSSYPMCENNDSYYCKTYVTSEINVDIEKMSKDYVNNSKENVNDNETKNELNKTIYLVGIVIIVILIGLIIVVLIRNRKKDFSNMGGM